MNIPVDTCFLIDHGRRNERNKHHQAATAWLADWEGSQLCINPVILAEFAEGFRDNEIELLNSAISPYERLPLDDKTAWQASRIRRDLRESGILIPDHDIWIASTAIRHGIALLTRNSRDFKRIKSLEIETY